MQYFVIGTGVVLLSANDSQNDDNSGQNNIDDKDYEKEDSREISGKSGDDHCEEVN
jgi:hypothetical protein